MNYTRHVLANGLRLVLVPQVDALSATVMVLVEAGSKYEDQTTNGLSHFLEHMSFKGSANYPGSVELSTELDGLGAHYNASTSQEYTNYYARVRASDLPKTLELIADMYCRPLLPEAEIVKERGVIIEEINMYADEPRRRVYEIFSELLYGTQPAGFDILGTKETVSSFKRDDFVTYRNKHYVAGATAVVIAGKFDQKTIVQTVTELFKDLPVSPKQEKVAVIEQQVAPVVKVVEKKIDQAHLMLGFRTGDVHRLEAEAEQVLGAILGGTMTSRLFLRLREAMGAAYYVSAGSELFTDNGYLAITAGVTPARAAEAVTAILEECRRFTTELVSEAELKRVKRSIIGTSFLSLETSSALAYYYGTDEIIHKELMTPDAWAARIEAVTAADIQNLAQQIFVESRLSLAAIGPLEDKVFDGVLRL